MFTSLTNRKFFGPTYVCAVLSTLLDPKFFGSTYVWAVLSTLPMDSDKTQGGLRTTEINRALGMPKEARTTLTLLLKRMVSQDNPVIRRYEYTLGNRKMITYKRLLPLRKRERIARFLRGV